MQAEVLSLDSLDNLESALAAFSGKAADAVAAMRAEFLRRQADLDGRADDARAEVDSWAEALQLAEDDDERASCACSLAEARERLGRILSWQARAQEDHAAFLNQVTRFESLLDQTLPRGREFLRSRAGELRAYGAVQPEPSAGAAKGNVSATVPLAPGGFSPARPAKLTDYLLPDGFIWVPLAEIGAAELAGIASKDDFKKVPYATMATGLRRLAAEILPRISVNPDAVGRDSFFSLDEAAGESNEDGLLRIYEAFFCKDFIYLERRKGQEKFEVTNGRHRIRVAMDLGWEAIPARVKDLRS
jgi:hypothetical protein